MRDDLNKAQIDMYYMELELQEYHALKKKMKELSASLKERLEKVEAKRLLAENEHWKNSNIELLNRIISFLDERSE